MNLLVTGANGQVGTELRALQDIALQNNISMYFLSRNELNLSQASCEQWLNLLNKKEIDAVINCAAYTKVDLAETEREEAFRVNHWAVEQLAKACEQTGSTLIQISTDFVFDGSHNTPYKENAPTCPLGCYGQSKLAGEEAALTYCSRSLIVRTAWVYSSYGHNFVKTMLRLAATRPQLNVVYDQIGSPTYAADLAQALLTIAITQNSIVGADDKKNEVWQQQIYHYANEGVCSWYDLAYNTLQLSHFDCIIRPIETTDYPTPARRPAYSVLHTEKIRRDFGLTIPYWRDSLQRCLQQLKAQTP